MTIFAEGCHGHLTKQVKRQFNLTEGKENMSYGIGLKEVWEVDPAKHQAGLVEHTVGWPMVIITSTIKPPFENIDVVIRL